MTSDFKKSDDFDDNNDTYQHDDDEEGLTDEELDSLFADIEFDDEEDEEEDSLAPAAHYDLQKLDDANHRQNYGRSIVSAAMSLIQHRSAQGFALSPMKVRLAMRKGRFTSSKELELCIYTDDYFPMCDSTGKDTLWQIAPGTCAVTIPCRRVWMPGRYFMMIYDSQDAMTRYDFTISERMKVSAPKRRDCLCFGPEDVMRNCLEQNIDSWQRLTTQPGAAQLRHYTLKAVQLDLYNRYCKHMEYGTLKSSNDLVITTHNGDINGRILACLAEITLPYRKFTVVDCATLYDITNMNPYDNVSETFCAPSHNIFCLTNIGSLLSGAGGKTIVRKLLELKNNHGDDTTFWICASRQEVGALFDMFPSLARLFLETNRLSQQPYTTTEQVQNFVSIISQEGMEADVQVTAELVKAVVEGCRKGLLRSWSLDDIRRFVAEKVRPGYQERVMAEVFTDKAPALTKDDLHLELLSSGRSAYEESIAALRQMVGLDNIKQSIVRMADNTRFTIERQRRGLPTTTRATYHAIFTGNPGTGKTTVARQLGRIYHALGLLSKGNVVSVDRTRLVGRFIGETEDNMKTVLEEARGNVLFIDEAYTLHDGATDRKDYGARVIDSLLTVLSQPDPDMLVVFAGYAKEMEAMLATNPGLAGRFPYMFEFKDYTAEQLTEIALRLLKRDDYILTDDALATLKECVARTVARRNDRFGNARWVEQFVCNGIIPAMAARVMATPAGDFRRVEAADVSRAYDDYNARNTGLKTRRQVGFSR